MLLFCPLCSNILTVSPSPETGRNRLECRTCPYQHAIEEPMYSRRYFKKKEREDVFGGPGAWDNADKTQVQCNNSGCNGKEAAFYQIQIRSADEPMTSFYKVSSHPRGKPSERLTVANTGVVYDLRSSVERKLVACVGRFVG
ncbi:hypothetical protein F4779DRAFT_618743 [Xylariaceae sp. FL0662B]|nr:hypothetical protein F4779DRAFT_618743 [Xylariaceae sp. FL0662B]